PVLRALLLPATSCRTQCRNSLVGRPPPPLATSLSAGSRTPAGAGHHRLGPGVILPGAPPERRARCPAAPRRSARGCAWKNRRNALLAAAGKVTIPDRCLGMKATACWPASSHQPTRMPLDSVALACVGFRSTRDLAAGKGPTPMRRILLTALLL